MGANATSRPQTQPDPLRMFAQVKGSPFDSTRREQTPKTGLDFPDTEEVTGSNPVRPTRSNPRSARMRPGSTRVVTVLAVAYVPAACHVEVWVGESFAFSMLGRNLLSCHGSKLRNRLAPRRATIRALLGAESVIR